MTNSTERSPRQTRHLSFVSEFTTDVQHIAGKNNVVADALSRALTISGVLSPSFDYVQLARDQETSEEVKSFRNTNVSLQLQDLKYGDASVLCDISTNAPRPILPPTWTKRAFDIYHNLSHAGHRPTQKAIAKQFVWPSMKKDIKNWCQTCHPCQSSKIQRHVHAPLQSRPPPRTAFRLAPCRYSRPIT